MPSLTNYVTVPEVLARRMAQVGLVDALDGARLQSILQPGQRLVSVEGDLWRWDGFRAGAEDAPSAAALRLQQLNRLEELKQDLVEATARAEGASQAHEVLKTRLADLTRGRSGSARRAARGRRADDRGQPRAEPGRGRPEHRRGQAGIAAPGGGPARGRGPARARADLAEAERAVAELGDLDAARARRSRTSR